MPLISGAADATTGYANNDLVQAQGISFTVSTLALAVVLVGNGTLNTSNALGSALAVVTAFVVDREEAEIQSQEGA